ncbi:MAG: hypothetical protein B6I25_00025 [Planctomycetales bacterium 4572_13]|nr:MAG: hypothetical protein B6I25_00025 [Planctomycetales bacterium 4572_13]
MLTKNVNSVVQVLVLARPADSVCAILASVLRQWQYAFSVYSTVYEVVDGIKDTPAGALLILVARPAMLGSQATVFIERNFPNLRIIGWIDSGENISDYTITQTAANGTVMMSHPEQLRPFIHSFCKTVPQNPSVPDVAREDILEEPDRLEYELSDDEVTALLGVE